MKKLLTALTAAAIGLGGLLATEANAQMAGERSTTVSTHHERHEWTHRKHARRVCNTVWRHHRKVQQCRTVWR